MFELKDSVLLDYLTSNGSSYAHNEITVSNPNCKIAGVWIQFDADSRGTYGFFMASETVPDDPLNAPYKFFYNGTVKEPGTETVLATITDRDSNVRANRWIHENGSSQNFVTWYNQVFNETKTQAQIFAQLQEIYGDTYNFFCYGPMTINAYFPIFYGNYRWGFYQDPANTHFDAICTNSVTGYVINDAYIDSFDSLVTIPEEYAENVTTMELALTYFMCSPAPLPPEKLVFDVYVDGVIGGRAPSIQIKWRNDNPDTSLLSSALIKPHIWGAGYPGLSEPSGAPSSFIHTVDGVVVPDGSKTPFNNIYSFDDEGYSDTYIGASDSWYQSMSDVERVLNFGIDMIPITLVYLLRFDYIQDGMKWGDLWYVYIPYNYEGAAYCEHAQISDSGSIVMFQTEVNVIGGLPPEEPPEDPDEAEPGADDNGDPTPIGPYDPDSEHIDFSTSEPEGFSGNSVLTKTYCMPTLTMQNVGGKLWSQSYFDVLKVQANPIENIIACKWFPFYESGQTEEIQVGNVPFGVTADRIANVKVIPFTSSYKYTTTSNRPGYLSCSPYTMIKLHLPYCGVVQLDATEILERTLNGKYVIDLITGDVLVILTLDGMPYLNISGKMGVDIPLSATNRAQTELGIANKALSATLGAAAWTMSGNYMGAADTAGSGILSIMGMDYTTQRSGTHSPACSTYEDRSVWIEITRSIAYVSEGYRSGHGYPAHVYKAISKGAGFIKIDKGARITVAMTDEENRELEQIMQNGCYF